MSPISTNASNSIRSDLTDDPLFSLASSDNHGVFKRDKVFDDRCKELIEFKEKYGHTQVPKGKGLGNWVKNIRMEQNEFKEQRRRKNPLKPFQLERLERIGFLKSVQVSKATKYFRFLLFNTKDFELKNGHVDFLREGAVHDNIKWFREAYCFLRDSKTKLGKDRQRQFDKLGIKFGNTNSAAPIIEPVDVTRQDEDVETSTEISAFAGVVADDATIAPVNSVMSPPSTAPAQVVTTVLPMIDVMRPLENLNLNDHNSKSKRTTANNLGDKNKKDNKKTKNTEIDNPSMPKRKTRQTSRACKDKQQTKRTVRFDITSPLQERRKSRRTRKTSRNEDAK